MEVDDHARHTYALVVDLASKTLTLSFPSVDHDSWTRQRELYSKTYLTSNGRPILSVKCIWAESLSNTLTQRVPDGENRPNRKLAEFVSSLYLTKCKTNAQPGTCRFIGRVARKHDRRPVFKWYSVFGRIGWFPWKVDKVICWESSLCMQTKCEWYCHPSPTLCDSNISNSFDLGTLIWRTPPN